MTNFPTAYQPDFSRRDPAPEVDEALWQRWSPRAFRKVEIPSETLTAIFDAARWSPSCFNEQPWLILTSATPEEFALYHSLLAEKNQLWAGNAAVLGFMVARRFFSHNHTPNRWAAFDTGSAWMSLTMQARKFGLYTHGMGGIKQEEIYRQLGIPEAEFEVICGFALGVIDRPEVLPNEDFQALEVPSGRKPLAEIWQTGRYTK
ncbi:MAG: nitroreductase [Desulfobulbaceae bacterium]|nr:nitroreductase [Desulfobulbaceae bacterium]